MEKALVKGRDAVLGTHKVLVALFPASLCGEGLRRAFRQLSPAAERRFIGWRGRLGLLPLIAVGPRWCCCCWPRRPGSRRSTGRVVERSRSAW